ncbi:hypothetical protein UA70_23010, partial [Raoultella planticola]
MKAAVVFDLQQGPVWADFTDPQADARHSLVKVNAAAISHVVKGRASGKHYSFDGRLPFMCILHIFLTGYSAVIYYVHFTHNC